ncbi:MAG: hypothetical protein CMF62_06270 [Magnetococcales bacterium]|nr:hypothetical protein [Magnetococcales bacterium]|tara:strand:+ start:289263 stop:289730 length:468 start_codon:yes stop_codon:yes gene_type:complete
MKAILALDLGTKTGWAAKTAEGKIISGNINLTPKRKDSFDMRYVRFKNFLDNLYLRSGNSISLVCFEEVRRHAGTGAAHVYGGFQAYLKTWCGENNIPHTSIAVGTWKKHFTGKGNSSKSEIQDEAKKRNFEFETEDEADAIGILHGYLAEAEQM